MGGREDRALVDKEFASEKVGRRVALFVGELERGNFNNLPIRLIDFKVTHRWIECKFKC
jgi:hypothetical protein